MTRRCLLVGDTQIALEALGQSFTGAFRRRRSGRVAVTGSAGKTTTKEMLRLMLARVGPGERLGLLLQQPMEACPCRLSRMPCEAQYGVFELGMNHAGEIRALVAQVRPHVAIITTMRPHICEYFGNGRKDCRRQGRNFRMGMEKDGIAILPADNPQFARLKANAKAAGVSRILAFGTQRPTAMRVCSPSQNDERRPVQ